MKKAITSENRMNFASYRSHISELLNRAAPKAAKEACAEIYEGYLIRGIFPAITYIKAIIACAEGHLVNPPAHLPNVGVEFIDNSRISLNRLSLKETCLVHAIIANIKKERSSIEINSVSRNALSLIRLFSKFNPDYFHKKIEKRTQ